MKKLSILFLLALVSCRLEPEPIEELGPLHVVATTGIIADCLENIVGDSAEVSSIMGPGTDPHIYKPTPGDIDMLDGADVIIANGLHLEGKMAEMLEKYGREKPVIFISDGIEDQHLIKSADATDAYDPHIWFDTKIWMKGMKYVVDELGKIDTNARKYYSDNFNLYQLYVDTLNLEIARQIDSLDPAKRILVTSHDAFSYFGRRYGVEVRGIQGISTLSEVGLKDISETVDFVVGRKIKAIFVETSTSQKTAQSIVDGAKQKRWNVELAGPLYSDALGEPDSEAGTYLGMIGENVRIIVEGLK